MNRKYHSAKVLSAVSGDDILSSFGDHNFEGKNVASAMEALANADAVCFDVDSTVIQEEGIVSFLCDRNRFFSTFLANSQ